jgi:hypothetical protein
MIKICAIAGLAFIGAVAPSLTASAWDQYPLDEYLQRSDTVTLGAGDAAQANSVIHTIDPWPRYVGDNRIPGHGERMSGAIERHRDVSKLPRAPKPIAPIYDVQGGSSGGGSNGGGGSGQ